MTLTYFEWKFEADAPGALLEKVPDPHDLARGMVAWGASIYRTRVDFEDELQRTKL